MVISIAEKEVYIPKTNGNDKADEPIVFNLRFLTVEEQTEMEYFQYSQSGTKSSPSLRVKTDNKYIFSRGVESIEGLKVGLKDIDTAEKFLAVRGPKWMGEMVSEVSLHHNNSMEIDEKN